MVHLEIGDGLLSLAKMLSIFESLGIYPRNFSMKQTNWTFVSE